MSTAVAPKRRRRRVIAVAQAVWIALALGGCLDIAGLGGDDDDEGCSSGWGDCDGVSSNGCETKTSADPINCGSCGHVCVDLPGAQAVCASGKCDASCSAGVQNCDGDSSNGCETDVRTNVSHCGACGRSCAAAHSFLATCQDGECAFTCEEGFADCDGDPDNGCETDVTADEANCGTCKSECAVGEFGTQLPCQGGQCGYLSACKDLTVLGGHTGIYAIKPPSGLPYDVYCNMDDDDGGWTLLLKVDGKKTTFTWDGALWLNTNTLNPDSPGPPASDDYGQFVEAKVEGYASIPFTQVRLETRDPRDFKPRALVLTKTGSSLLSLMTSGGSTGAGKSKWTQLMMYPVYTQDICNKEAFKNQVAYKNVRLGLIMNEPYSGDGGDDCKSPDTAIGIGLDDEISCGNTAHGAEAAVKPAMEDSPTRLPAYCYLYVR